MEIRESGKRLKTIATKRVRRPPPQPQSSSSETEEDPTWVEPLEQQLLYQQVMKSEDLIESMRFDFNILDSVGFHIRELVEMLGWKDICEMNVPVHDELVRKFYAGLQISVEDGNIALDSIVNGKAVHIDEEVLTRLFKLPMDGQNVKLNTSDLLISTLEIENAVFSYPGDSGSSAMRLNPINRMLHYILNRSIIPKRGSFAYVSRSDKEVLWHVLGHRRVNVAKLILQHIQLKYENLTQRSYASSGRGKEGLPYGMLLTKLFKESRVALKGLRGEMPSKEFLFSVKNLKLMKLRRTANRGYVYVEHLNADDVLVNFKGELEEATPKKKTTTAPSSSTAPPPQEAPSSSTAPSGMHSQEFIILSERLDRLQVSVDSHFHELSRQIGEILNAIRPPHLTQPQPQPQHDPAQARDEELPEFHPDLFH